jgi:hypothetical protein
MAYTKYSLTPADNNAAPPNGAPEGMLPSAVNDTMRDMMSQIRDVGDGIRGGTYTMTAPIITGGTITGVALTGNTFTSPVISGGSINNTPIGATTANTGAFSTLSATGVTTVQAGSVSAPAITTTGDTNTGIFFPAADTIAFAEGGVESVRIDSSGNVGIGTSSPAANLHISKSTGVTVMLSNTSTSLVTNDVMGNLDFTAGTANTTNVRVSGLVVGTSEAGGSLVVETRPDGGSLTERMRITSAGDLLVGTTSAISSGFTTISYNGTSLNGVIISESAGTSGTAFLGFNSGATNIGSVSRVGLTNAVVYSTTSDQRLKSNIADANPVLDKLMTVKVRQFDWTEGDLHQDAGFIAQELAPVLSGIVTEGKTEEDMWQMDYSRLTPYLVKAIQELKATVDAQAARIAALENPSVEN